MKSFAPTLKRLEAVPDPRRAEGKRYALIHILLYSILAIVTTANLHHAVEYDLRKKTAMVLVMTLPVLSLMATSG